MNYPRLALIGLILITAACYWAGISAGFLLDDYATLPTLSRWGSISTFDKLTDYLASGFTGPTGRPIALLSFLFNSTVWPADPMWFQVSNITIHLINGLLLYWLGVLICVNSFLKSSRYHWGLLLVVAIWLLHPLHVSTVLYIVQRMTSLAWLFSLLSLISYVYLRSALIAEKYLKSIIFVCLFAICALLAVYTKEIAVLIPQQMVLIDWLISRKNRGTKLMPLKIWIYLAGWLPTLMIWGYILSKGFDTGGFVNRGFNVTERIFTEINVVADYIKLLVIPKAQTSAVFYDGYTIVKHFGEPLSNVFYLFVHLSLIGFTWLCRFRYPLLFFGVFWFYSGHILESTTVSLELMYEHRNYIPSIGLAVVLGAGFCQLIKINRYMATFPVLLIILYILVLNLRVYLWSDPVKASFVWAELSSTSLRAQENAILRANQVRNDVAIEYFMERARKIDSENPYFELKYINYLCSRNPEFAWDIQKLSDRLSVYSADFRAYSLLESLYQSVAQKQCAGIKIHDIQLLARSIRDNNKLRATSLPSQMEQLVGDIFISKDQVNLAVERYDAALALGGDEKMAIYQSRVLAENGYLEEAFERINAVISNGKLDTLDNSAAQEIRSIIIEDIARRNNSEDF